MLREISTKSGIFAKCREILHFFAKYIVPSARGAAGAFGASIRAPAAVVWRALWRSFDAPFLTPSAPRPQPYHFSKLSGAVACLQRNSSI